MKVWDRAGIELAIPGSAARLSSVARHVTDSATRPGNSLNETFLLSTLSVFKLLLKKIMQFYAQTDC